MQIPLLALVLCVLIPVSGFIAWAGDRIGHVYGKRRHTLLGLRPRHTAMLFTVGSGIGISLVSFLMLYFSSEGFRVILSQGVRLLTINKSLRRDNARLQTEVAERAAQTQKARQDARTALADRDAAKALRDAAEKQSDAARRTLSAAQTELKQAQAGLSQAQAQVRGAAESLTEAQNRLGVSGAELAAKRRELKRAQSGLVTARARIAQTQAARDQATRELAATIADKKRLEATATRQFADATARIRELAKNAEAERAAIDAKQAELSRLQTEVAELEKRRTEKETQLAAMATQLDASLSKTTALRRGQITFRVGEEVARVSVSPDQSIWRIESALERFWKSAGKKAEERGATPTGTGQAVAFAPHPVMTDTPTEPASGTAVNLSLPSEDEVLRLLAQNIRRGRETVAIILTTSANAVEGEPVLVDVHTFRNPQVLAGGVKLGETTINAGVDATREQVTDQVYEFLRRDVRKALLDAGVIPVTSGDVEDGTSVVRLTGSEWLKLMDDLKRSRYRARLLVKTAKPLRAADPVSLAFEIKALPPQPMLSGGGAVLPRNVPVP